MDNSYYLNLIPSEHRLSPNFINWLTFGIQKLQDDNSSALDIINAFDLDTATGTQLDIIGTLVGISRQLDFQPRSDISSVLDDVYYRLLLRARIVWNQWKGTIKELYEAWQVIFPAGNLLIMDNQDMSMDIVVSGNFSVMERELINNGLIVPKSEGVRINYIIIEENSNLPVFSYGYDNEILGGYNSNWIREESDLIFGYGEATKDIAGYDTGNWL
ncbi:DUF2612 domain-containing protein [Megamonas hypermegale]|uniref:DUF2612 domain-containing protein n=1 Tax=Megamonas hypermegale TaxID=158847 RepID=UPI0026E9F83E|nr:DUF2612 domain-containing protein [Megamonas hypermegale]